VSSVCRIQGLSVQGLSVYRAVGGGWKRAYKIQMNVSEACDRDCDAVCRRRRMSGDLGCLALLTVVAQFFLCQQLGEATRSGWRRDGAWPGFLGEPGRELR
jgi:hypothetical protein